MAALSCLWQAETEGMEKMGSTIFLGMFRVWGLGLRTGSKLLEVYCRNYCASWRT